MSGVNEISANNKVQPLKGFQKIKATPSFQFASITVVALAGLGLFAAGIVNLSGLGLNALGNEAAIGVLAAGGTIIAGEIIYLYMNRIKPISYEDAEKYKPLIGNEQACENFPFFVYLTKKNERCIYYWTENEGAKSGPLSLYSGLVIKGYKEFKKPQLEALLQKI